MKTSCLVFALAVLLVVGYANATALTTYSHAQQLKTFQPDGNMCDVCIGFMQTDISLLVNIIVEVGIEDGCAELCSFIPNGLEADICTIYCEVKGINEFSRILQEVNPDPIAACMALKQCPMNQYAKGKVNSVVVSPTKGPQGANFNITMVWTITNTTGTGQIMIEIVPPNSQNNGGPIAATATIQAVPPGTYTTAMQLSTQPNQDSPFNPGLYQVIGAVCESICGGTTSYSFTIGLASTRFTLTN